VRLTVALLLLALLYPSLSSASISPVSPIDTDVVDYGGVAMAPDGTGGIVYRKRVDGRTHVFAAQFDGRGWRPAQRVDDGQAFDSSWPAIGAANGGRLVVAWVQEFGPSSDRMYSAAIDPGARRFQAPVPIDLNVGESTGTFPSLAMNGAGQAFIAYLIMRTPTSAEPTGYARGELRVARYDGSYWSATGFPLNRNSAAPLRLPVAGATPEVTIDLTGNGILAWQEPDDAFVDRVWARRLFGSGQVGIPVQVSKAGGAADAFSLDGAGFGQGAIAFRSDNRISLSLIPETSAENANVFGDARPVDGGPPAIAPGAPSVAVDRVGDSLTAFGIAQRSLLSGADDRSVRTPERLDDGRTAIPGTPQVDLASSGAAVAAWAIRRGGAGGVGVSERRADGVPVTQALAAPAGGAVTGFGLAGSGLGDALVGWVQNGQAAAVIVDAPPDPFAAQAPIDYVRRPPQIQWDPPAHAIGGVSFAVTLDDDTLAENLAGTKLQLSKKDLDDGVHVLQVVATDAGGQETTSTPAELKYDATPPKVTARRYRNGLVEVRVTDKASGVDRSATKINWGDGKSGSAKVHRYASAGVHVITVTAADKAGNKKKVKVRK